MAMIQLQKWSIICYVCKVDVKLNNPKMYFSRRNLIHWQELVLLNTALLFSKWWAYSGVTSFHPTMLYQNSSEHYFLQCYYCQAKLSCKAIANGAQICWNQAPKWPTFLSAINSTILECWRKLASKLAKIRSYIYSICRHSTSYPHLVHEIKLCPFAFVLQNEIRTIPFPGINPLHGWIQPSSDLCSGLFLCERQFWSKKGNYGYFILVNRVCVKKLSYVNSFSNLEVAKRAPHQEVNFFPNAVSQMLLLQFACLVTP